MNHLDLFLQSVAVFFLLVLFIQVLKRQGIFNDSHQPVFNRLITELILPVTIFSTLGGSTVSADQLVGAGIMMGAVLTCCFCGYLACRLLRLPPRTTGSVVLLSGIGSTATMAYPLLSQTYGTDSPAMTFGIMAGELGVGVTCFTFGVIVATYFGSGDEKKNLDIIRIVTDFLRSPIAISLILGVVVSQIPPLSALMTTGFVETLSGYFAHALEMMVAISIGLMLRPVHVRLILPILGIVVVLKMLLQPVLVFVGAGIAGLPDLSTEVLIIEASMPSGAVATIIANRYGCDGAIASTVVIATYLIGLAVIPLVTLLML